ncbi:hypothetical protein F4781DRAFT_438986 [Annulohypoxylon bovei var. microspora]|nr:hypothetical protein F4781DRAFT_438986 [Annulohypoxylon bovei var. microspora]
MSSSELANHHHNVGSSQFTATVVPLTSAANPNQLVPTRSIPLRMASDANNHKAPTGASTSGVWSGTTAYNADGSARPSSRTFKACASWKEAFKPIVDSVPSEDASIPAVRKWFCLIGYLHGFGRREIPEFEQLSLLGHNLRQANHSDLKEYLVSIAMQDGYLKMHAAVLAADAYEAVCLKKFMEAEVTKMNAGTKAGHW